MSPVHRRVSLAAWHARSEAEAALRTVNKALLAKQQQGAPQLVEQGGHVGRSEGLLSVGVCQNQLSKRHLRQLKHEPAALVGLAAGGLVR